MRSVTLGNGLSVISREGKYYVIDEFAKVLLESLDITSNVGELSHILNLPVEGVRSAYKVLEAQLNEADLYSDNLNIPSPLKVHWRITNNCNLKCSHCYVNSGPVNSREDAHINIIGKKISELQVLDVTISGGEALTVSSLDAIIKRFSDVGIGVKIFTNGTLLARFIKNISHVIPRQSLTFEVSIDGLAESHEIIRGNGTFEKTMTGIKAALAAGYQIMTNTVLCKNNYRSIPELYRFLSAIGVQEIQISNLIVAGRATQSMRLNAKEAEWFLDEMRDVVNEEDGAELLYGHLKKDKCVEEYTRISNGGSEVNVGPEKWRCGAGVGKVTVDPDGQVLCCPYLPCSTLGNIKSEPFDEIWSNPKRYKFIVELARKNSGARNCMVTNMSE